MEDLDLELTKNISQVLTIGTRDRYILPKHPNLFFRKSYRSKRIKQQAAHINGLLQKVERD